MLKPKVFISWSSGKESALALFRLRDQIEPCCLLNMVNETQTYSRSHRIVPELIQAQADAMGIPLRQQACSWDSYEKEFKQALAQLRSRGLTQGVFGDIDTPAHRDWVERVCREQSFSARLPLWRQDRLSLVREGIAAGFKAVVVVTDAKYLGPEWLGREISEEFLQDIAAVPGVDPAGENGEFHTFVYDGPLFGHPVAFMPGPVVEHDGYWFLELQPEMS